MDRRDFLKLGGLSLLGLAVGPQALALTKFEEEFPISISCWGWHSMDGLIVGAEDPPERKRGMRVPQMALPEPAPDLSRLRGLSVEQRAVREIQEMEDRRWFEAVMQGEELDESFLRHLHSWKEPYEALIVGDSPQECAGWVFYQTWEVIRLVTVRGVKIHVGEDLLAERWFDPLHLASLEAGTKFTMSWKWFNSDLPIGTEWPRFMQSLVARARRGIVPGPMDGLVGASFEYPSERQA